MRRPRSSLAACTAALLLLVLAAPAALGAETVAPLPESDYSVRAACPPPTVPRHASCLAEQLVPASTAALLRQRPIGMLRRSLRRPNTAPTPASGLLGLRPQDLHSAYSLPRTSASEQTVAIVDAFNDPTIEADLRVYDEEFGLPACTTANGCFREVSQTGSSSELPFPQTSAQLHEYAISAATEQKEAAREAIGWGTEISLDVETVHATCQNCHILLVVSGEAGAAEPFSAVEYANLEAAEKRAEDLGATEISNSWGGSEAGISPSEEALSPFHHPGTVITASAGDDGYENWDAEREIERGYTQYPASSPDVVAVGGTRLAPLGLEGAWRGETVWNGDGAGGGGCSTDFQAPAWQQQAADWSSVGCGSKRSVDDVAADADPYSGEVIYDSDEAGESCETRYKEGKVTHTIADWCTYGGTSLASPIIASTFALAGGANAVEYPAQTLYWTLRHAPGTLHDVTSGSNGECAAGFNSEGFALCVASEEAHTSCGGALTCLAGPGYDGPTGVGTPNGDQGFVPGQQEAEPEPTPPPSGSPESGPAPAGATPGGAPPHPPASTPTPSGSTATVPQVSALGLTPPAVAALSEGRPSASKIGFSFTLSTAARVRVTLARRVRSHGRTRWVTQGHPRTIAASAGRNAKRLTGRLRLAPGLYRLTIAPVSGRARSIVFRVR